MVNIFPLNVSLETCKITIPLQWLRKHFNTSAPPLKVPWTLFFEYEFNCTLRICCGHCVARSPVRCKSWFPDPEQFHTAGHSPLCTAYQHSGTSGVCIAYIQTWCLFRATAVLKSITVTANGSLLGWKQRPVAVIGPFCCRVSGPGV